MMPIFMFRPFKKMAYNSYKTALYAWLIYYSILFARGKINKKILLERVWLGKIRQINGLTV